MTIRVQPSEAVFLRVNTFVPSLSTQQTSSMDLDLSYHGREIPEAYEVLLLDALKGDEARSVRGDELDASWKIWTPLLKVLDDKDRAIKPREYPYGESCTVTQRTDIPKSRLPHSHPVPMEKHILPTQLIPSQVPTAPKASRNS